jgi:hypothetical protein
LGLPTPFHVYRRLSAVCTKLRLDLESAAGAAGVAVSSSAAAAKASEERRTRRAPGQR